MNAPSDRPLKKVTLNLFRDDVAELVRIYGNGWTSEVRNVVADHVRSHRRIEGAQTLVFKGAADGQ